MPPSPSYASLCSPSAPADGLFSSLSYSPWTPPSSVRLAQSGWAQEVLGGSFWLALMTTIWKGSFSYFQGECPTAWILKKSPSPTIIDLPTSIDEVPSCYPCLPLPSWLPVPGSTMTLPKKRCQLWCSFPSGKAPPPPTMMWPYFLVSFKTN